MTISYTVLDRISATLDKESLASLSEKEFYYNIVSVLSKEIDFLFAGVSFLDDSNIAEKAFTTVDSSSFNNIFDKNNLSNFLKFINSKQDKTFAASGFEVSSYLFKDVKDKDLYFLFSKLQIKKSVFGFIFCAKNKIFTKDEIAIVNAYSSIYSYLIKDYELNKVYKTQLAILQDTISDKETAYKNTEKQNKKLIRADSAKTAFLANVSHELRTPLNALIGFSEVLLNQIFGKLNKKQFEYVKDINLSSVKLLGLINSLLDFSKIESGSMKLNISSFNPQIAVSEVINLLKPLLDAKEIKIEYENTCNEDVRADYQKFQQILFNLLGNAIKFSAQNSRILVKTYFNGEYFTLEVEDFGIGIEKKYHNFIFKKFTQIDNIYTKTCASTGLGLAITKEYVKLHNGKIYVESKLGQGSTFVVKLNKKVIK